MSPVYPPPPATPPAICQGAAFVDAVGTDGPDRLNAYPIPTRVWGLDGADQLTGSAARASCLLGGPGHDVLNLGGGGGVAHGNTGRDVIFGSLLGDVIDPGRDVDLVLAGAGDDKLATRDGQAEVIDCGPGGDVVRADRSDVLIGCEATSLAGASLEHVPVRPTRVTPGATVRFRLTKAGNYRVVYIDSCRTPGETVLQTRRRTFSVRPPTGGWCRAMAHLAVVRDPLSYSLPPVPVARVAFTVR